MEKDRLLEEIKKSCDAACRASYKVLKKARLKNKLLYKLTEKEEYLIARVYQWSTILQYITWAYERSNSETVPEVRAAVENAVLVTCKEIEKLVENLKV